MKKALILGVTGQDGSYISEFLIKKKYIVFGLIRKSATGNKKNISHLLKNCPLPECNTHPCVVWSSKIRLGWVRYAKYSVLILLNYLLMDQS